MPNITITPYTHNRKSGLLNLLSHMWHELTDAERKKRFEWRYEKNPYQDQPFIFLALDGERVAGFRAFVVQLFMLHGKAYKVYSPADAIVHPNYRRRGVFSNLNDAFLQEVNRHKDMPGIILNLTSNRFSTPGYLKQYWQETNGVKRYYYKYSIPALFKNYVNSRTVTPGAFSRKDLEFEITNKINSQELAAFNEQNRNPYTLSPVRDEAFYNWKYSYNPEQYLTVYARKESSLQAYLILKRVTGKQYALEEYGGSNTNAFIKTVSAAMKRLQVPLLRSWAFAPHDQDLLKKAGFYPEPTGLMKKLGKERLPILVRPAQPKPDETDFVIDGQDIRQINNWQIQLADRH